MNLVYKNYRLSSEFNLYPFNSRLSLGIALCRAKCLFLWPNLDLKGVSNSRFSHLPAICFCLLGSQ